MNKCFLNHRVTTLYINDVFIIGYLFSIAKDKVGLILYKTK